MWVRERHIELRCLELPFALRTSLIVDALSRIYSILSGISQILWPNHRHVIYWTQNSPVLAERKRQYN